MPEGFRHRVLDALTGVPAGQVVSYGELAAMAGYPGAARGVGAVLSATTAEDGVSWWRVVYADGRLAPCDPAGQARLLAAEGVAVEAGRVQPG